MTASGRKQVNVRAIHAAHQFYIFIKVTCSPNLHSLCPRRIIPFDKPTLVDCVTLLLIKSVSLYSVVTASHLSPDAMLLYKKRVSSGNQHCPYALSSEIVINDKGGNASEPTRLMKQFKYV